MGLSSIAYFACKAGEAVEKLKPVLDSIEDIKTLIEDIEKNIVEAIEKIVALQEKALQLVGEARERLLTKLQAKIDKIKEKGQEKITKATEGAIKGVESLVNNMDLPGVVVTLDIDPVTLSFDLQVEPKLFDCGSLLVETSLTTAIVATPAGPGTITLL